MDFNFRKIFADTVSAVLRPQTYFTTLPTDSDFSEPTFKVFLYGVVVAAIHFMLKMLHIAPPVMASADQADPLTALLALPALYVLILFLGAVLVMILSALAGGKRAFPPAVHVTAGLMALQPLSTLANIAYVNVVAGALANQAFSLFWIWMFYHAMLRGLGCRRGGVLVLCGIIALLSSVGCIRLIMKAVG